MKASVLLIILALTTFSFAQVGIGTTTPSANAALDVNSTNKGLMLPRLSDTASVSNPSAGLMIYDLHAKTPAFHDGSKWSAVASQLQMMTENTDSITYTITGATGGFSNGIYPLIAFSNGASNPGSGSSFIQDISISKLRDINTIPFSRSTIIGGVLSGMSIEIRVYLPGSSTPYYSIKGTNAFISSFAVSGSSELAENISFLPIIFGYKDWVNNISFAWNKATNMEVPY
jgi:type VI protein secretion system component Hcp